jgi:hypothetical protein
MKGSFLYQYYMLVMPGKYIYWSKPFYIVCHAGSELINFTRISQNSFKEHRVDGFGTQANVGEVDSITRSTMERNIATEVCLGMTRSTDIEEQRGARQSSSAVWAASVAATAVYVCYVMPTQTTQSGHHCQNPK